ncbi:MAG: hypothetical protein IJW66_05040 [Clostridia bacterium]|nr:hypothetical protein [Clostridia bacterium]
MKKILNSIHPDDDAHYEKMGLRRGEVELFEDGAYIRFSGTAKIERLVAGEVVECVEEPSAVWEMMYFGKTGADKAHS